MKFKLFNILLVSFIFSVLIGCRGEFETVRVSGDTPLMIKKGLEYYDAQDYIKAQTLFELVLSQIRGKAESEEIYFKYAYTHFYQHSYLLAAYYFKNFTSTFPNSSLREESDYMEAFSYYKLSPSFRLDQSETQKAIDAFQLFANTYPQSEKVKDCNKFMDELREKLEQKTYNQAVLYYDLRQYQSATHAFQNLLRDFPDSKNAEEVRYLMVKAAYHLAENSVYTKQEERYSDAISFADLFLDKYDSSKYRREVKNIERDSNTKMKIFK